jgi:hypothetical protein
VGNSAGDVSNYVQHISQQATIKRGGGLQPNQTSQPRFVLAAGWGFRHHHDDASGALRLHEGIVWVQWAKRNIVCPLNKPVMWLTGDG